MNKKLEIDLKKLRKLTPSKNIFASLVRSIIYQQLSGKAAAAIERKFFGLFDPKVLNTKGKYIFYSMIHMKTLQNFNKKFSNSSHLSQYSDCNK